MTNKHHYVINHKALQLLAALQCSFFLLAEISAVVVFPVLVLLARAMTLINFTVYCSSSRKTLLSWQIVSVHPPSHTFHSFFESEVRQKCAVCCRMTQVHAGKTKEALDQVDPSLIIADVTGVFGNFVKYTTDQASEQVQVAEV